MIFSNFGIWNFDNLICWDIENIMFGIYMFVILVGQALVFLLVRGAGAEPSLPEKKNPFLGHRQTVQNAASDQVLHCLLTENPIENKIKIEKYTRHP